MKANRCTVKNASIIELIGQRVTWAEDIFGMRIVFVTKNFILEFRDEDEDLIEVVEEGGRIFDIDGEIVINATETIRDGVYACTIETATKSIKLTMTKREEDSDDIQFVITKDC
jgi:hypothetical protein